MKKILFPVWSMNKKFSPLHHGAQLQPFCQCGVAAARIGRWLWRRARARLPLSCSKN